MYYFFYGFLRVLKVLGRIVDSILAYTLSILARQAQLVIRILFLARALLICIRSNLRVIEHRLPINAYGIKLYL